MCFTIIRKADRYAEAGAPPTEELIDAMQHTHEKMAKAGVLQLYGLEDFGPSEEIDRMLEVGFVKPA